MQMEVTKDGKITRGIVVYALKVLENNAILFYKNEKEWVDDKGHVIYDAENVVIFDDCIGDKIPEDKAETCAIMAMNRVKKDLEERFGELFDE